MPTPIRPPTPEINLQKIHIPPVLHEVFGKEPRIVTKPGGSIGIWPVGPEILRNPALLQKLINDKEFNKEFDIAIIRR
jgi:hypothetical protein